MRLPYLQIAMEIMELAAPDLAVVLDRPESEMGWGLLKVFRWALGRCPDNAPPSTHDVVKGASAARLVAGAANFGGDPEAYVDALCSVGPDPILERVQGGIRVCGLNRYDQAWLKNQTKEFETKWRAVLAAGRQTLPEPDSNPIRNRTGTVSEPRRQTQTQTQIQKETKEEEEGADAPLTRLDEVGLQNLWNTAAHPDLPRWQAMPKGRKTAARARIREQPDWNYWAEIVDRISASAFCRGANDRGWRAGPDFILRPDTAAKVLEGAYDDAKGRPETPSEDVARCHVAGCEARETCIYDGLHWCYPHMNAAVNEGRVA